MKPACRTAYKAHNTPNQTQVAFRFTSRKYRLPLGQYLVQTSFGEQRGWIFVSSSQTKATSFELNVCSLLGCDMVL